MAKTVSSSASFNRPLSLSTKVIASMSASVEMFRLTALKSLSRA
jgi:hypothetical protein